MQPNVPPTTLGVLRLRDVRRYVGSRFFSSFARSILHATIAWHVWTITDSYFWLGVIGVVEFLPVIPVSLYAGALADHADRRRIVLSTQSVSLAGATLLALAGDGAGGEVALILAVAFALAIASSFENPAGSAILPNLVERRAFPVATVVQSNARNLANMSGPAAMGLITHQLGIPAAYAVSALAYALSIVGLLGVRVPRVVGSARRVTLASVREGIHFVRGQPAILSSITLDMFAVIFAGATALLPVYADEILDVGARGYGILAASMQIGTFLMAAALLFTPPIVRAGRALLFAVLAFGLATILFGLSRELWLSVVAFVLAGMADQVSMVARSIILQLSTPDAFRGRVSSVNMIFIGASNELGAAESGFLAALTSATFSVVAGGAACLGVLAVIWARVPALRRFSLAELPDPTPPPI